MSRSKSHTHHVECFSQPPLRFLVVLAIPAIFLLFSSQRSQYPNVVKEIEANYAAQHELWDLLSNDLPPKQVVAVTDDFLDSQTIISARQTLENNSLSLWHIVSTRDIANAYYSKLGAAEPSMWGVYHMHVGQIAGFLKTSAFPVNIIAVMDAESYDSTLLDSIREHSRRKGLTGATLLIPESIERPKDAIMFSSSTLSTLHGYSVPAYSCTKDVVQWAKQAGYPYDAFCSHYGDCTQWYMPEQIETLKKYDLDDVTKLMIAAHPDDEVIFGGTSILEENPSEWLLVICTNDYRRVEAARKVVKKWKIGGAIMLAHADHMDSGTMFDFRLYNTLRDLIGSKKWEIIETHGPTGEYGHPQHWTLYNIVTYITTSLPATKKPDMYRIFDYRQSNKPKIKKRTTKLKVEALDTIYVSELNASYFKEIYTSKSRAIELAPRRDIDITNFICSY